MSGSVKQKPKQKKIVPPSYLKVKETILKDKMVDLLCSHLGERKDLVELVIKKTYEQCYQES